MNNDLIEFKETQINLSDSTCKIIQGLNFFNINFNNNENEFLSLAYGCKNDVAVLDKFDANGASIFRYFFKHAFADGIHFNVSLYETIDTDARM